MISSLKSLSCDNCKSCKNHVASLVDEFVSDLEAISMASLQGWVNVKVENGGVWDFCPECALENLEPIVKKYAFVIKSLQEFETDKIVDAKVCENALMVWNMVAAQFLMGQMKAPIISAKNGKIKFEWNGLTRKTSEKTNEPVILTAKVTDEENVQWCIQGHRKEPYQYVCTKKRRYTKPVGTMPKAVRKLAV